MLTKNPLTIGSLKKWCAENCIPDDIPIGIYIGDSELGDIAYGVIGETKNKPTEFSESVDFSETTGEHCYCKNTNVLQELYNTTSRYQIVMITDGFHLEEV